jgi:hypothetical protein
MTLDNIIDAALLQLQRDADDLSLDEYAAALKLYINQGYFELLRAREGDAGTFDSLVDGTQVPRLPEWAHHALADFATYKALSCGSAARQARAKVFRGEYERVLTRMSEARGRTLSGGAL